MPQFLPERLAGGGSLVGNSYLSKFALCPWDWFNGYYRPMKFADDGAVVVRGMSHRFQKTSLNRGKAFHEGIAELYRSGIKDGEDSGEWDVDRAIDKAIIALDRDKSTFEKLEEYEELKRTIPERLRAYYDSYGLGAAIPDFPNTRVLCDGNGHPLIEREWNVELGYKDYIFTCKTDLICSYNGLLTCWEHKTSAPGFWAQQRRRNCHTDSQFTGELFTLKTIFPDEIISGVVCNIVIFGARAGGDVALREQTRRNPGDLEVFRQASVDILRQIDERVEKFENRWEEAGKPRNANEIDNIARPLFPDHGTRTGQCQAFRGCSNLYYCSRKGRENESMKSYVPRGERAVDEPIPSS